MRRGLLPTFVLLGMVCWGMMAAGHAQEAAGAVTIENDFVRYVIGADGRNLHFIDKTTGADCLDAAQPSLFAAITSGGQSHPASNVTQAQDLLTIEFAAAGAECRATVRVRTEPHYLRFEVVSLAGAGVDELTIGDVRLTLKGRLDEPFAACALALNLKTDVREIPGPNSLLRAKCYKRFGFEGAKVAFVACPTRQLRNVMKEVVSAAEELPHPPAGVTPIGGPWALDGEINRGSYLFDFGSITEQTVDKWAQFTKSLGLNQIDFHTGGSLRFGDCFPNPELFPRGRASVKAVIDKLHEAGISAGLHTYAFFIAKNTPYVTPVPDPRLGKDATFTLAESLAADAATVPVVETTQAMSTATAFFIRNSVTLQIDDELITYGGISKEPPYAFTKCSRGVCGTKAAPHDKGAKVHHLKECFGLFTPDPETTLLAEVAKNTADTFNECGFDMIYLDALDGEDILAGAENAWHYGSQFAFEIANRLNKPALFEMSTFHHHLWYVRARMGAWDHPCRSHKRFVDVHCAANQAGSGSFLPMNLGWWAVQVWDSPDFETQREPTFPDDIEYLMCKCLANDMGISLMGVNPDNIGSVPAYQRLAPIFKQYEDLRHANYFPESVKARLRAPGEEFTLEQAPDGKWQFRRVEYAKHKVQGLDGSSNKWVVKNRFSAHPVQLRIEALMSARPYDAPEGVVIEDFSNPAALADRASQEGVSASLESSTAQVKSGAASGCFAATNGRPAPLGAWTKIGKACAPPLNIAGQRGLGVWVYGDGQGELLNIQLKSADAAGTGGLGDHYITVDFIGWRYFELVELEGGRIEDYVWPYGGAYGVYREPVNYGSIETFSLWYNNLPAGKEVACYLGPIKALPLVKAKMRNPKIEIGGKTITFPVEIESGSYLEFRSMGDCKLYGPKGELLSEVTPQGDPPALQSGDNAVTFTCEGPADANPRAYVTAIVRGETIRE